MSDSLPKPQPVIGIVLGAAMTLFSLWLTSNFFRWHEDNPLVLLSCVLLLVGSIAFVPATFMQTADRPQSIAQRFQSELQRSHNSISWVDGPSNRALLSVVAACFFIGLGGIGVFALTSYSGRPPLLTFVIGLMSIGIGIYALVRGCLTQRTVTLTPDALEIRRRILPFGEQRKTLSPIVSARLVSKNRSLVPAFAVRVEAGEHGKPRQVTVDLPYFSNATPDEARNAIEQLNTPAAPYRNHGLEL